MTAQYSMTPEQENNLEDIRALFNSEMPRKYRMGQREHGGNLWEKPMAGCLMEEATDQFAYAACIKQQHRRMYQAAVGGDLVLLQSLALRFCSP